MYNGTREFDMVGLPDAAVRESKDRVLSALKNCGFRYPAAHMTVNLAPADIKKEGPIYDLPIAFSGLKPATAYTLEVVELAGDDPGYTDSDPAKASTTTADEPVVVTSPWVNVEFSYETVGGKGTLRVANKANVKCAHFYSSTETVNVIGEGYDDEKTLIGYILMDYEDGVPGVYMDTAEHKFNNNGAGFKAGDKLFYYVVGVDAADKPGDLNWFWVEIPANIGDPVIILDSPEV